MNESVAHPSTIIQAIWAIAHTLKSPKLRNRCVHFLLPGSFGTSGTVSIW
jgi:uncharacterized membrane protein